MPTDTPDPASKPTAPLRGAAAAAVARKAAGGAAPARSKTAAKPASATGKPGAPHHIRARMFAVENMITAGITLSALTEEAGKQADWILRGAPDADIVEARILALKVVRKGALRGAAFYTEAEAFEQFILYGHVRPAPKKQAEAPSTSRERPAARPASEESLVPADAGDAGESSRSNRRPSERMKAFPVEP